MPGFGIGFGHGLSGRMNALPPTLPLDAIPAATITVAYGTKPLNKAWANGNLFIANGNTIRAINGSPDVATLAALMSISATTGIGGLLCSKWFDQSGNALDATQATTANMPAVWLINGEVYMGFSGILSGAANTLPPQYFAIPAGASFNNRSISIFTAIKPYTTSAAFQGGSNLFSTVFSTGSAGVSGFGLFSSSGGNPNPFTHTLDYNGFAGGAGLAANGYTIQKSVLGFVGAAASTTQTCNGNSASAGALNAATNTGGQLGAATTLGANGGFCGRMQAFIVSSTILSGAQQTALTNALCAYSNARGAVPTTVKTNILIDGASIDEGQGGDPSGQYFTQNGGGYGWGEFLMDALRGYDIQWHNMASSGASIANVTTNYSPGASTLGGNACFNAAATKNILIGPNAAYGNSVNGEAKTGAQAYADFVTWLAAVKAQAWNNILCYILPASGSQAYADYNTLMIANAVANGITLIDMTGDARIVLSSTPPYFNTNGHPTVLGYQVMASYILPVVQALL